MKYQGKRFSVPSASRPVEGCEHGWRDTRGKCVMCGEPIPAPTTSEEGE